MEQTRREAIIEVFAGRLRQIQTVNGYATDAGLALYIGEIPALADAKDPIASIALIPGNEDPQRTGEHALFHWAVEIGAVVKIGAAEAWRVVENVIADIKLAIETVVVAGVRVTDKDRKLDGNLPDRIERGPVVMFPRESGSTVTGASVFYIVPYPEPWGTPRVSP